jgi:fermentation-respiration switch protein FrsA (DUF1100 family)
VACVYAAALLFLISQETRLVFEHGRPLGPLRPTGAFEQVALARADGAGQFAWIMRHPDADAPWVLYLHGNSATVASRANILRYERLRALGANVLAPEYRGFGGLEGVPSEQSVTQDAREGYAYLRDELGVPPSRLIVFGWSLGSAVAVNVASEVPAAAVILEGAPASLVAIGERRYPWIPIRLVMRNPFESIVKVRRISAPILFLHSAEDTIIPIEEGRRLFDAAREPKTFVEVRGGHIGSAEVDEQRFFSAIRQFLAGQRLLPAPSVL